MGGKMKKLLTGIALIASLGFWTAGFSFPQITIKASDALKNHLVGILKQYCPAKDRSDTCKLSTISLVFYGKISYSKFEQSMSTTPYPLGSLSPDDFLKQTFNKLNVWSNRKKPKGLQWMSIDKFKLVYKFASKQPTYCDLNLDDHAIDAKTITATFDYQNNKCFGSATYT